MTNPNRSKKLTPLIRERAVRAGRLAKAACRASGGGAEEGHQAYRSAYNVIAASYRRAVDPKFRARARRAGQKWRDAQKNT